MIIGTPSVFAIESGITEAYESLGFRAWGFFNLHVSGRRYGVHSPDATMLACSFDEVQERLARRGMHTAPFATESDAGKIANACYEAGWGYPDEGKKHSLGMSTDALGEVILSSHLEWAPDGDAAFDGGHRVLQFDIQNRVRLIAFVGGEDGLHVPGTLQDLWLDADEFYGILERWRDAFEAEWKAAVKVN